MRLSFWEYDTWFSNVDYTIIGSGIVGLNCALSLRSDHPEAKILVLEKGVLPQGASTKNAGFACFGSVSEILSDLQKHTAEEVCELVRMRYEGISLLRKRIGDAAMDYIECGGHEIFLKEDQSRYENCLDHLAEINRLLHPVFRQDAFQLKPSQFGFEGVQDRYLSNPLEGQLHVGKMMMALMKQAQKENIIVLNGLSVKEFKQLNGAVAVRTDEVEYNTRKLLIATNGFAPQIMDADLKPARAQVLITQPIPELSVKGTFHMDEGYYYFRNVGNRILLGGARNLDPEGETTEEFGLTGPIQEKLELLLKQVILPHTAFEIEGRWSGIMAVGDQKRPIISQLSDDVYCGVRLGGMGIAIGAQVASTLANMAT